MIRHTRNRPSSVGLPFSILIVAVTFGALAPDASARRIGWAVGMIALSWLIIILYREVYTLRQLYMAKVATIAVEAVGLEVLSIEEDRELSSLDEEWRRLNRKDK